MRAEHYHEANLPVRVPRGNDGFWAIMLRLQATNGCFTVRDIDDETNSSIKCISKYLTGLVAAGFAAPVSTRTHQINGKYPTPLYRLLKMPVKAPRVRQDGGIVPPTAQEQIWLTMRTLKTFSTRELVFAATTDDVKPKIQTAARFIRFLHTAGYLAIAKAGKPHVWRLKPNMNTGPLPPVCRQLGAKVIWDPNLGKFVGAAPVAREVKP